MAAGHLASPTTAGPSSSSSATPPQPLGSPIPLSKRTSSRHALRERYNEFAGRQQHHQHNASSSPPTTPPPRNRRAPRKEKGKQPPPLKTHASAEDYRVRDNRHSHGLSWSSTTRDSVVDNLLFSLDNLSRPDLHDHEADAVRAIGESDFDQPRYPYPFAAPPPTSAIAKMQRPRGHTYSSSSSSAYEGPGMMGSPASTEKGRRSNASSQYGMQHSMSTRLRTSRHRGTSSVSTETQKPNMHGLLGRESEDTSGSFDRPSVDYGYSTTTSQTNNRRNRRSLSMDQINEMFSLTGNSMINRGRPVPSVFSPFDSDGLAAPEPMVAAGPRKQQNPTAFGPVYVNQAPPKSSLRKITTQTDLRTASMAMPSPPIPQDVRNQATDFVRANSMRGVPSIPGQEAKALPSPSLHRSTAAASTRERPGFFKRVFGGSSVRSSTSSNHVDSMEYGDLMSPALARNSSSGGTHSRSGTRHGSKEHPSSGSAVGGGGTTYPPVSLNKKPSFFRRRKKSNSENGLPPPPLPLGIAGKKVGDAQPSPGVSSLRKVMDPFLADGKSGPPTRLANAHDGRNDVNDGSSRPATQDSTEDSDTDNLDIFHSGYTPPPDASLGRRNPLTRLSSETEKERTNSSVDDRMRLHSGGKDATAAAAAAAAEKVRIKVKRRKNEMLSPLQNTSFLLDASSRERSMTPPLISPANVSPITATATPEDSDGKENRRPVSRASTGDRIIAAKAVASPVEIDGDASRENSNASAEDGFVQRSNDVRPDSKKSERLILVPTASEEMLVRSGKDLPPLPKALAHERQISQTEPTSAKSPAFHTATSAAFPPGVHSPTTPSTQYHSATSLPLVQVDGNEPRKSHEANGMVVPSTSMEIVDEGAEYRERARKIFDGDEEDVMKAEAASWLGEKNTLSTKTLEAYMQLFDFAGFNILVALRLLCGKLALKGETQQFDRIINALSRRWCECNPNHGFKAQDVVHTICYSLILLNTDLHLADIGEKMSRSAYVKNTLPTIKRVATDAAPHAFDETLKAKPTSSRPMLPWSDSNNSIPPISPNECTSFEHPDRMPQSALKRLSMRPNFDRADSDGWTPTESTASGSANAFNALVNSPWNGPIRGWEFEIENILKSFYASIRSDPLPLFGAPSMSEPPLAERNLSVQNFTSGLKRTGSVVSKAPSENMSYRSKAGGGLRNLTMGFQNKYTRSRPKLYPNSAYGSSGTSFDDGNSVWSPVQSSNWSKYSASKTLTSASMQSLGTAFSSTGGDFKHSIGFANALSQAIIREENAFAVGDGESMSMSVPGGLLEDESLALEGAPWAKEGMVQHKHHLEGTGKKAKERSWNDCFAVLGKGKLTLFAFNTSSSSKAQSIGRRGFSKAQPNGRAASATGQKVGGGDWMENAEQLNVFVLRQTIASVLPPPGYSKARPHVWALSLPSGAVHLFQVGTPEIAAEFMTTANYWSARLSKEPLSGGVSNVEYGWSENVINPALLEPRPGTTSPPPLSPPISTPGVSHPPGAMQNRTHHIHSNSNGALPRPSFQSSLRGSFDTAAAGFSAGVGGARARLPGDKVQLAEWQPPTQSMMASALMEVDQLRALRAYVAGVEGELAVHNELKGAIELAYSPRHANYTRAISNWQRKSDHLLREIVKFQTYADSLEKAQKAKEAFYARKEAQRVAAAAKEDSAAAASPAGNAGATDVVGPDTVAAAVMAAGSIALASS